MAESQTEPHFNIKIEREERQQQQQRCFNGGDDNENDPNMSNHNDNNNNNNSDNVDSEDYYEVLGLGKNATSDEVKKVLTLTISSNLFRLLSKL